MNPRLVLSLWRERWGKTADAARGRPYLRGQLNQWGGDLTDSSAWSLPGVTALALTGCVLIYIILTTAQFSLGGQMAFSILFVSTALYVRRYAGTLVTLVLFGMFAIVSTRYLYWRLTATLGSEFNLDFVLGFGLWVAELYLWLLITLRIVRSVWPLTRASVPLPTDSAPVLFRVDDPFLGQALRWKQRLVALQAMLQFYYTIPRLIFFTAPLAYLLAGISIIQTTPALLGAYALPYLLLAHVAQARLQGTNRLTVWGDIREAVLAWYLLLPTTLTLVRTELRKWRGALKSDTHGPFDWLIAWPYGLVVILNLAGLSAGVARLLSSQSQAQEIAALYLLWCVGNLMLLAAMLAVAQETRDIRQQTRALLQLPAMVQLPSGRTIACMTQNFPQTDLSLKLPVPLAVEAGAVINLSIFRGYREFTFPARVASQHNSVLSVRIEDMVQNDYRLFSAAVLSRGPDWPQWLPGRDADHPLPPWVTRPFIAGWTKVLTVAWIVGKFVKSSRLGNGIGK